MILLKKENKTINITVHAGDFWNHSQDFLLKQRSLIERKE
jgi:hypothetical protein